MPKIKVYSEPVKKKPTPLSEAQEQVAALTVKVAALERIQAAFEQKDSLLTKALDEQLLSVANLDLQISLLRARLDECYAALASGITVFGIHVHRVK
jgi:uncharacterized small protein (DUF1192 family)